MSTLLSWNLNHVLNSIPSSVLIIILKFCLWVCACMLSAGGSAEVAWPRLFGLHYEPRSTLEATETVSQRAPASMLPTCSMGSSVYVWGEGMINTYTYTRRPVVGDPVWTRRKDHLLALTVGDNCDDHTVFCWSETTSTVAAITPTSFWSWLIDG